jgi:RHS repeat-associated protein
VLAQYDGSNNCLRYFVYGNYIDEPLLMVNVAANPDVDYYYVHDHLYSPVALLAADGTVAERYEYNAYGRMTRLNYNFTTFTGTEAGNPYYFTGRSLDTLDGENSLEIMYYRNRYYKPSIGRFMQNDPLSIVPNAMISNKFKPTRQYKGSVNLYEYVRSVPVIKVDPSGLVLNIPGDEVPSLDWWRIRYRFPRNPPSLVQGRGTFGGSWSCCPNGKKALDIANTALMSDDECASWFRKHGARGETFGVNVKRFLSFGSATLPLSNSMYIAQRTCKKEPADIASLLVHEAAHHFCPLIIFGGESCATEAQEVCHNGILNQY